MKRIFSISILLSGLFSLSSCIDMMNEVKDVERVEYVTVSYKVNAVTGFVPKGGDVEPDRSFNVSGLNAVFTNLANDAVVASQTDEDGVCSVTLDPGVYSVSIYGVTEQGGQSYYINGNISSVSLYENITKEEALKDKSHQLNVRPAKVGGLIFSEIYYCGASNYYFRDQTYQVYNNGDKVEYLDGVCFAQLYPNIATATKPVWPDEEGEDNYVYALWVWQFPGTGHDYPLAPGESVVIVQEARNHVENNPDSFDNSMAQWECSVGNELRDNAKVPNMPYIFYTSFNKMQWLTSVFGAAFALYKPEGDIIGADYYSVEGEHVVSEVNKSAKYARIDANSVLDGLECLPNMNSMQMKRIPGFVDAGGTSVGATYIGKSVSRKVISHREDGTPIFQDTNNSTIDFEVMDRPAIRRYGEKEPAWGVSK